MARSDIDTVIKTATGCVRAGTYCNKCIYEGCITRHGGCQKDLIADMLDILKSQQAEISSLKAMQLKTVHNTGEQELLLPGDEVIVKHGARNGIPFHEMAVVTRNDEDHFCYMLRDGTSYHCRRSYANPVKTGRHFDIPLVLKQMEEEFE